MIPIPGLPEGDVWYVEVEEWPHVPVPPPYGQPPMMCSIGRADLMASTSETIWLGGRPEWTGGGPVTQVPIGDSWTLLVLAIGGLMAWKKWRGRR